MLEAADLRQVADLAEGHENVAVLPENDKDQRHKQMGEPQDVEDDVGGVVLHVELWPTGVVVEQLVNIDLVDEDVGEYVEEQGDVEHYKAQLVPVVFIVVVLADHVKDVRTGQDAKQEHHEEQDAL